MYYNNITGVLGDANYFESTLNYSCTTPLPTFGVGNFTNAPLFVDQAGGNFRLQSNSPCINSGRNAYAPTGLDLDGNPRIAGGTVDVGAYEFQSPQSSISYAWLQGYGLPTDGSADNLDLDGDQSTNFQEWRAGTDPTDAASVFKAIVRVSGDTALVEFDCVAGKSYRVWFSNDLESWQEVSAPTFAFPQPGRCQWLDDGADTGGKPVSHRFYRVSAD